MECFKGLRHNWKDAWRPFPGMEAVILKDLNSGDKETDGLLKN